MYHFLTTKILQVLSKYKSANLDGYFIAKIIFNVFTNETKIGLEKREVTPQTSVITIFDSMETGEILNVILMKTTSQNVINKTKADIQFDLFDFKMMDFKTNELSLFIDFCGDNNSIHTGDEAIVPGILMLDKTLKNTELVFDRFEIKFSNPLFVNERIIIIENNLNILGLNEKYRKVFELKKISQN